MTLNPIFHIDAGDPDSYPGTGSTWYDLSDNHNDVTLTGSPTWDSNGWLLRRTGSVMSFSNGMTIRPLNSTFLM